jgi:hypothetical protein
VRMGMVKTLMKTIIQVINKFLIMACVKIKIAASYLIVFILQKTTTFLALYRLQKTPVPHLPNFHSPNQTNCLLKKLAILLLKSLIIHHLPLKK